MNDAQMLKLMDALDNGTNMFGALKPGIRARLFAVVDSPDQQTWDDAYTVIISNEGFMTLWQACLEYSDYHVTRKLDGGTWEAIPTREQLMTALTAALASD